MNTKNAVSSRYLADMKLLHGHKRIDGESVRAFMTGDAKSGSIGERIRQRLMDDVGATVKNFTSDIRDYEDVLNAPFGKSNALIMCHGVSHLDWFEDCPPAKFQEIMEVNVTGTMMMTQAFVNQTIGTNERKSIIMIGSMAHKAVLNGSAAYCASKAAVAHLARCLAWELAPKGFDVYCIHPSNTLDTPMSEETIQGLMRYRHMSRVAAEEYWNDTMIRSEPLTTDEIADLVLRLLSGEHQYLAGAQLELAGGQR